MSPASEKKPEPASDPRPSPPPPNRRWAHDDAGAHYVGTRWRNARKAARDPRLVERLLAKAGVADAVILDAPCGTGRLLPGLAGRARLRVGCDVSEPMLRQARSTDAPLVQGDLARLPFASGSFDAVVCCRLLHHFARRDDLDRAIAELVRVSRGLVLASFWDAGSIAGVKRRLRPRPGAGRVARSKAELRDAFHAAGAEVTGFAHSMRWVSQQTFLIARVDEGGGAAR